MPPAHLTCQLELSQVLDRHIPLDLRDRRAPIARIEELVRLAIMESRRANLDKTQFLILLSRLATES